MVRRCLDVYIPKKILSLVADEKPKKDRMGMSGSHVYLFSNMALKIHNKEEGILKKEYDTLLWLKKRLPVPEVLLYIENRRYTYLLMSRIPGLMTCDTKVLDQPYQMISRLAEGLKMLWKIDINDCPFDSRLKHKLMIARRNLDAGEVDINQAEDETFGEQGFKNPEELYTWLATHQPEEDLVFSHSDYCLPNVFVDENGITGFIDFDRAGIACKWADIALCVRSIYHNFGHHEAYISHLFKKLDMAPDWTKIRYYILLDELY